VTVAPAARIAPAVAALAAPAVLVAPLVTALHVTGDGPMGFLGLGDPGENGERAAERQCTDGESNDLVHGILHSHGLTGGRPGHVSSLRGTTG